MSFLPTKPKNDKRGNNYGLTLNQGLLQRGGGFGGGGGLEHVIKTCKIVTFLAFRMILTTSTLTHILQNRRFTWDLSQKRSFSSHLATANPNGTAWFNTSKTPLWNCNSQWNCDANVSLSRNPAPVQRNASPFLHDIPLSCKSQWNSGANRHVTRPWKVTFWSSPQRQCHRSRFRTLEDGCGRLRTRKQRRANTALPSDSQVKREPFATHSGKIEKPHQATAPRRALCKRITICQSSRANMFDATYLQPCSVAGWRLSAWSCVGLCQGWRHVSLSRSYAQSRWMETSHSHRECQAELSHRTRQSEAWTRFVTDFQSGIKEMRAILAESHSSSLAGFPLPSLTAISHYWCGRLSSFYDKALSREDALNRTNESAYETDESWHTCMVCLAACSHECARVYVSLRVLNDGHGGHLALSGSNGGFSC